MTRWHMIRWHMTRWHMTRWHMIRWDVGHGGMWDMLGCEPLSGGYLVGDAARQVVHSLLQQLLHILALWGGGQQ